MNSGLPVKVTVSGMAKRARFSLIFFFWLIISTGLASQNFWRLVSDFCAKTGTAGRVKWLHEVNWNPPVPFAAGFLRDDRTIAVGKNEKNKTSFSI